MTRRPLPRWLISAGPAIALLELLVLATLIQLVGVVTRLPFGVDIDIPLRAAERWVAGGQPYLASAFAEPAGRTFPFLYPPYVLPLVTPLLSLPRDAVFVAWDLVCLGAALVAFDRLAIPRRWWPLLVAWTPVAEAVWNGNVHVVAFAAFCVAFWQREGSRPWHPEPRSLDAAHLTPATGALATIVGAVKPTQVHAWILLARRAPRSAVIGAVIVAVPVLATLPLTGIGPYFDWLAQMQRAADPHWIGMGWALAAYLPGPLSLGILVASLLAIPLLPRRDAATWTALLLTIAAPNLRNFSWMFCLPALLGVRWEIALLVAFALTTWSPPIEWASIAVLVLSLLASYRWPWFAAATAEPVAATAPRPASA